MIYFDNAATGGFKPRAVTDAAQTVIRYLSANPGRSGHRLSITGAKTIYECRELIAQTFSASPDKVIFTKNCTEALNLAIFGSLSVGGHVITTTFEHNSVLRPLFTLKNKGLISLDVVSPTPNKTLDQAIKEKINDKTYLVACTAVSNVTGEKSPLDMIGKLCAKHNLCFLVDGAQGGGHIHIDMKKLNITYLALAGHKGLYGIMGSGVLLIEDNADLEPLILGGTGSDSFNLTQPRCYPERLEAGTLNLPAIAALKEGVGFIKNNQKSFANHLLSATSTLIDGLKKLPEVTCYSTPNESGIVAFSINGLPSAEASDLFNTRYDVAVRGGFHCSPLTHRFLKTDNFGLVRASLAVQNSSSEINYFVKSVADLVKSIKSL